MKKLLKICLLLLLGLIVSSCNNDDLREPIELPVNVTESDLDGKWIMESFIVADASVEFTFAGQTVPVDYRVQGENYNFSAIFSDETNTVTAEGSFDTVTVTSLPTGDQERKDTFAAENLISPDSTWSIENGNLIIAGSGSAEIIEFTGQSLTYQTDLSQPELANLINQGFGLNEFNLKNPKGMMRVTLVKTTAGTDPLN